VPLNALPASFGASNSVSLKVEYEMGGGKTYTVNGHVAQSMFASEQAGKLPLGTA